MVRVSGVGRWIWALGFCLISACAPTAKGVITPDGYSHTEYHYQLAAEPQGQLMPEGWKIDNYFEKAGRLQPKDAPDYAIEYDLDRDGDGEFETRVKELRYDLRFRHSVHDGVVFLRTVPMSADLQSKKLSVLMERYVEGIAGAGYEVVQFYPGKTIVIEKRYAAAVVDKAPAKIAGLDAYVVTLDVANIDQLQVDANARSERVQLVLAHTNFTYKVTGNQEGKSVTTEFPVVLLVGYGNHPEEFDAGLQDFHDFLGRLVIDQKRGFEVQARESAPTQNAEAEGASETTTAVQENAEVGAESESPPTAAPNEGSAPTASPDAE